jgi:catechol 2,3-dioxygenase-like lactoylglutathione lyase family enzyme
VAEPAGGGGVLEPATRAFYCDALAALTASRTPFLVGGAYAFARYTGIERHTKDLDIFVHPGDVERVLAVLQAAGFDTDLTFPHWLAKARCGGDYVDVIFSSGNGIAEVDDAWFTHAVEGQVLDTAVRLCPPEEMIWSKAFIQERERFDGADVMHVLRARAGTLDWERLLRRFGRHWRVLLAHLVMFGFVYPGHRRDVPADVLQRLLRRLQAEQATPAANPRLCQGPLVSRAQYLVDIERWGYQDARLVHGTMTEDDTALWTAAIGGE